MAKIAKGVTSALVRFFLIAIIAPYVLEYLAPTISTYLQLPPANAVWTVFILVGSLFAVTGYLQNAYSKGDYPWLFGRIGSGLTEAILFTYLFLLLPNSVGSAGVQSTGLLSLIYLAVALSYAYLVLDFYDARRSRPFRPVETDKMY